MPFNLGFGEIAAVLILALLLLGPDKLPHAARTVGSWITELKRHSDNLKAEFRDVVDLDEVVKLKQDLTDAVSINGLLSTPSGTSTPQTVPDGAVDAATLLSQSTVRRVPGLDDDEPASSRADAPSSTASPGVTSAADILAESAGRRISDPDAL